MPKWINSAIQACFYYNLDCQYLIKKDEKDISRIVPFDSDNNGEVQ